MQQERDIKIYVPRTQRLSGDGICRSAEDSEQISIWKPAPKQNAAHREHPS